MAHLIPFIPAIVGAGVSLINANQQANAVKQATRAQERGQQEALQFQRDVLNQQQGLAQQQIERAEPFRQIGLQGAEQLGGILKSPLGESPGFKFAQQQGEQALGRAFARTGGISGSGTALEALNRFTQGNLAQEQERRDRLLSQALNLGSLGLGQGLSGAQIASGALGQFGPNVGNIALSRGLTGAQGAIGQGLTGMGLSRNLGEIIAALPSFFPSGQTVNSGPEGFLVGA